MRFAFSTASCPKWDLATAVAHAKEYGYDGMEIRGFLNESPATAIDLFGLGVENVRDTFAQSGLQVACLSSTIAMTGDKQKDLQHTQTIKKYADAAQIIGCNFVKIHDAQVRPGQNRSAVTVSLGKWLRPLADYALQRNVTLVVENGPTFRAANEMWMILEQANHCGLATCWDVFNAATIGEGPLVSIPMLNSRIAYAQIKDAKLTGQSRQFCKLGDGDVAAKTFVTRLMGIGYKGWITFDWPKAFIPELAEPQEILPDALAKLKDWTKPPVETKPKAHAKPTPAAAKAPAPATKEP